MMSYYLLNNQWQGPYRSSLLKGSQSKNGVAAQIVVCKHQSRSVHFSVKWLGMVVAQALWVLVTSYFISVRLPTIWRDRTICWHYPQRRGVARGSHPNINTHQRR